MEHYLSTEGCHKILRTLHDEVLEPYGAFTVGETVFVDPKESGFEVSSDDQVWGAKTDVEIFRASYENGEYQVTVKSENGDSLIAPGNENSFVLSKFFSTTSSTV